MRSSLSLGFGAASLMAAAGVLLFLAGEARSAPGAVGPNAVVPQVEMDLPGLTVPATVHAPATADRPVATLTPSCDAEVPGGCEWLQVVCGELAGAMSEGRDGRLTCTIALD